MKKYFIYLFLFISTTQIFAQYDSRESGTKKNKGMMNNWPMIDTKSLQQYYQNVFSTKQDENEQQIAPSYSLDREQLLEKLKDLIPLQGVVNPNEYLIGPNDFLNIDISASVPLSIPVQVSPEGIIVIPSVGSLQVAGNSLTQVKDQIEEKIMSTFLNAKVSTTLIMPRIFSVTVSGVVSNPGNYYAAAVQRVDQVIYMANLETNLAISNISETQNQKKQLLNRPDYIEYLKNDDIKNNNFEMSLRNIRIIRNNKDTLIVDLVRYYATGDNRYNPFLSDGDRIIVPNLELNANSISVTGEVRIEGTYEYSEIDSLSSILEIAQGPTRLANLDEVELFRTDLMTGKFKREIYNLNYILSGKVNDVKLLPGDRIVVRRKFNNEGPFSIVIKGEVNKPGLYPITKDKTFLSEVIEMAGGFTEHAFLSDSKVIRFNENLDKTEKNPDYKRLYEMRLGEMNQREREYYTYESAINRNFVSVNFVELFYNNKKENDVILQDGDIVLINPKQNTIYVYGQVVYPGYINYAEGMDLEYYVDLAGGVSTMADEGNIKIIKAGSKNWLRPDKTEIEPGDAIWIPREKDFDDQDFPYYFGWFASVVQVVAGVATIFLLIQK